MSSSAGAAERASGGAVATRAGVIGVVSVNIGRWATDGDHKSVVNGDGISCQNLCAGAAKRDIGIEFKLAVAPRRVKFQRRIRRKGAAAHNEHTVWAKYADLEDIGVHASSIDRDLSIAVDA